MKNKSLYIASLLLVLSACNKKKETVKENDTESYTLSQVKYMQPTLDISLPGDIQAYYTTQIYPKVRGFVKVLKVDRGSYVRKGEVLAILYDPELQYQKLQLHSKIENASNRYVISNSYYQRLVQTNKTKGAVSQQELEEAQNKALADKASVNAEKANLGAISQMEKYLVITAPIDGYITERNISVGDLVSPEDASKNKPLFKIDDTHKLRLVINIPETYVNAVTKGQMIKFKVRAIPGKEFQGTLSRTSVSLNDKLRSLVAEYDISNENNEIRAGMYADASMPFRRTDATAFVPSYSIINSTESIYVVKEDHKKAVITPVKLGATKDSLTEIFGNIKDGDHIISSPTEDIKNGQFLKIK